MSRIATNEETEFSRGWGYRNREKLFLAGSAAFTVGGLFAVVLAIF